MTRAACRGLAGVLALASVIPLWFGFFIALLSVVVAAQHPDPAIPNGDPCCGHPDTWGEVVEGMAWGVGTLIAWAALVYVAVALGKYAATGATPPHGARRRLMIAAALLIVWALTFFGLLG